MTDSPLLSTDPNSLQALFDPDKKDYTPEEEARLVRELRRRRDVYAAEDAAKAASGKRRAKPLHTIAESPDADKPLSEVNLDDLI